MPRNEQQSCWVSEHPGQQITKNNFPGIFKMAWDEIVVGEKAKNSFKKVGICPFDVENVDIMRLVANDGGRGGNSHGHDTAMMKMQQTQAEEASIRKR